MNIIPFLQKQTPDRLWLMSVLVSIVMTEIITGGMALLLNGEITAAFLLTGFVTALCVASLVVTGLIFLFKQHTRTEQLLEFENHALMVMSGNPPLCSMLDILCLSVEKILEGTRCSVLLLDDDGVQLQHGAAPSLQDEFNHAVVGADAASCNVAVQTAKPVIVTDIGLSPLWEKHRELALTHGLGACWAMPVYSGAGKVVGVFACYHRLPGVPSSFDLHVLNHVCHLSSIAIQRRRADDQLKRVYETLEERVADEVEKNREKDYLLIRQSRLAAMGEMIGNIAHQWRQPLNALGLVLSNIKDEHDFNELDTESLGMLVGQGRRIVEKMSTTIDDFRNFFRPDKVKQAFSLKQAVADTLEILSASFRSNCITAHFDAEEDVTAFGFPNEYSQVLLNLFNNAKDAMLANKAGQGEIRLHIARDGGNSRLTMRDSGGGIPPDILPKIFDPYFTTREKGTGIGLYMSKMIIEDNMNGRLEVRNIEGGAEFVVICPLAESV